MKILNEVYRMYACAFPSRYVGAILLCAVYAAPANAVSKFVQRLPNGGAFSCSTCHTSVPKTNQFGKDFKSNGKNWSAILAALDSDGDGFTNGAELLDPNAFWTQGDPDPGNSAHVTNPGDPSSVPAPPEPTVTPTATPTPTVEVPPTATPTIPVETPPTATPTLVPQAPPVGVEVITLDAQTDELLIAATNGYQAPVYSFTDFPQGAPDSALMGDGRGICVFVSEGSGFTLYGPVVNVGPGKALIQCSVYAESPDVSAAVAGLSVPDGGGLSGQNGSVAVNMPTKATQFANRWELLELVYDPDGDALSPIFQVVSASSELVKVYLDQITVTPLQDLSPSDLAALLQRAAIAPGVNDGNTSGNNGGDISSGGGSGDDDDEGDDDSGDDDDDDDEEDDD